MTDRRGTRFRPAPVHNSSRSAMPRRGSSHRASTYRTPTRIHPRSSLRRFGFVAAGLVVCVAVVALAVFFVPPLHDRVFGPSIEVGKLVRVSIPEGASGDAIASLLSEHEVIPQAKDYYAAVERAGASSSIKAGEYQLTTGEDPDEVVAQLVKGPNVEGTKLTIPEGLTVSQVASRVEDELGIASADFLDQAKASNYEKDYSFLKGAYNDSLEGYLYPKTYTFSGKPSADEVIRTLLDQFKQETASLSFDHAPSGLSTSQVVALASLVERESAVQSERPLIASVIYNRLAADMPLQIDAAIVYARGGGSRAVTYEDLKIDSPYNTYEHKGLTPGPICSPSISSLRAALEPAQTQYLYYVASSSLDGSHVFSSDYAQFEKDRQAYYDAVGKGSS